MKIADHYAVRFKSVDGRNGWVMWSREFGRLSLESFSDTFAPECLLTKVEARNAPVVKYMDGEYLNGQYSLHKVVMASSKINSGSA